MKFTSYRCAAGHGPHCHVLAFCSGWKIVLGSWRLVDFFYGDFTGRSRAGDVVMKDPDDQPQKPGTSRASRMKSGLLRFPKSWRAKA